MVGKAFSRRGRAGFLLVAVLVLALALPAIAHAGFYVNARVEAPTGTVFRGNVWVGKNYIEDADGVHPVLQHRAISSLDEAARRAGFAYSVSDMSWGLMVVGIDGLRNAEAGVPEDPLPGWMYRVNGVLPMVGADQYLLKPGDKVLWYYGVTNFGLPGGDETTPLAIRVSSASPAINTTLTVTAVEVSPTGESTTPVAGAAVSVGSKSQSTDSSGQARFRMSSAGTFQVMANKDGYVKSDVVSVRAAYPSYLSFYARPSVIRRGSIISLTGRLRSNGQDLRGRTVVIQYTYGSGWRSLRGVTTRPNGIFATWLRPARTGYYRAVFTGDRSHLRVTSVACRVIVR